MPREGRSQSNLTNGIETWDMFKPKETRGQIVFARIGKGWWPGIVIQGKDCGQYLANIPCKEWILWYGDERVSLVFLKKICSFRRNYAKLLHNLKAKKYMEGMKAAIDDCAFQDGMDFLDKKKEKGEWAANGFLSESSKLLLSDNVKGSLERVKKALAPNNESTLEDMEASQEEEEEILCLIPNSSGPCTSTSFFGKLRSGTNKIKEVCISCKNEEKEIESQHPLFEGGICEECKEKWKNHIFESDENGAMTTCAVCAQVGEMLVCGQVGCNRVYCTTCIRELAGKYSLLKFKELNPWHCMMCRGYINHTDGYLVPKENWWDNVTQLFKPTNMDRSPKFPQRKNRIRVLSLYDGISTGAFQLDDYHENANSGELSEITLNTFFPSKLVENGYSGTPAELGGYYCLTKLGFKIDAYFSSGVEENAAVVSKMHFGDKITPVGEVENLTHLHIDCLRPIDVVIGGSSCNDLSGFKPASKKFDDGPIPMFFEFYRVLKAVQALTPTPVYWFYECNAKMPLTDRHTINRFLDCSPRLIDAQHYSAQRRPRFYWANIPEKVTTIEEVNPNLPCPVIRNIPMTADVSSQNIITSRSNSSKSGNLKKKEEEITNARVTELEELLGFPPHFTDVGHLVPQQRLDLLGKSFNAKVLLKILQSLEYVFDKEPGMALNN